MMRRTFLSLLSVYPLTRLSAQDSAAGRLRTPEVVQERARTVAGDNDLAVQTLEKRLRCTCGCNLDVFTCRTTDFTCATSPAMHREVLRQLESSSPDEVVANFVAQYGESILMQPQKRGFNWSAYLTPFAALVVGGTVLTMVMRRFVVRSREVAAASLDTRHPTPGTSSQPSETDRALLKAALDDYES